MKVWEIAKGVIGLQGLRLAERPEPQAKAGQVVIAVRAASLNYRDQAVLNGGYPGGAPKGDVIPLSDGAGEVVAVGEGVTGLKVGDRVAGTFFQRDPNGPAAGPPMPTGAPLDGWLAEKIALYEDGLVKLPTDYSYEEGACLPCAGVTAWHALELAGKPIKPGDTVLVQGTGGVSLWALAFARAAGCRVIATTSHETKAQRLRNLGASDVINYKSHPDWDKEALGITGGRGVDVVVEVGGSGTLGRSFTALAAGGKVSLIGVLTHYADGKPAHVENPSAHSLMMKGGNLHGIFVGDRAMFESMTKAIDANGIKPVIDKVFGFGDAPAAYRHAMSGDFMGKIVIGI